MKYRVLFILDTLTFSTQHFEMQAILKGEDSGRSIQKREDHV